MGEQQEERLHPNVALALMATGFLVVCALAALLVPGRRRAVLQPRVT